MSERQFWIAVRSALLLFVDAIERRWSLGRHKDELQTVQEPKLEAGAVDSRTTA